MSSEQTVILTPGQARGITALEYERQETARKANEELNTIAAAIQEQGKMLSLVHGMPRGKDVTYRFDGVMLDEEVRIKMTVVEPEEKVVEAEAEAEIEIEEGEVVEETEESPD